MFVFKLKPLVGIALGIELLLVACGGQAPTAAPPSASAVAPGGSGSLYEAAKKEAQVIVNTHDPEREKGAVAAFQKRYPGIQVQWLVGRGQDAEDKVLAEAPGNVHSLDVMEAGPNNMYDVYKAALFDTYQSPSLTNVREDLLDPDKYKNPAYVLVYGIAENTNLVPANQEPKSWQDLLDPRWKGKIAIQDPRGSGGGMIILVALSKASGLGLDYIRQLAGQNLFINQANEQIFTQLMRGEYAFMISQTPDAVVQAKAKDPKAPVQYLKPAEGVAVSDTSAGVLKSAPHPNAARLWVDWRLSQEGQEAMAQQGNVPVGKSVKTPYEATSLEGVKLLPVETQADRNKRAEYSKQWDDIFFKRG